MKYLNIAFIVAGIFFLSSCSDFLDVDSQERIEAEDSEENYTPEQFVTGVYGMFTDWDYAFSFLAVTEIISDNADKGSSPADTGADKNLFDELTFTSTAGSLSAMWSRWYKTIGRATQAIDFTESYGLTDEAYKNRLIGESKFLRAVSYFWLVRGWGDVTLQHIDNTNRAPKEEVYAFIEQDLTEAMQVLPVSYNSANLGRATRGAAHGLLSKVYLYQEKWQEAYDAATAVINSSEYNYSLFDDLESGRGKFIRISFRDTGPGRIDRPRGTAVLSNSRGTRYHRLGMGLQHPDRKPAGCV